MTAPTAEERASRDAAIYRLRAAVEGEWRAELADVAALLSAYDDTAGDIRDHYLCGVKAGREAARDDIARLVAALDGARREERARGIAAFATWLRRHDALAAAWEMADEVEEEGAVVLAEIADATGSAT